MECDNISNCHNPIDVQEDMFAQRVLCTQCKHQYILRKDPYSGAPEKKEYARIFKRLTLQGNDNLFYKIYPQHLRI